MNRVNRTGLLRCCCPVPAPPSGGKFSVTVNQYVCVSKFCDLDILNCNTNPCRRTVRLKSSLKCKQQFRVNESPVQLQSAVSVVSSSLWWPGESKAEKGWTMMKTTVNIVVFANTYSDSNNKHLAKVIIELCPSSIQERVLGNKLGGGGMALER